MEGLTYSCGTGIFIFIIIYKGVTSIKILGNIVNGNAQNEMFLEKLLKGEIDTKLSKILGSVKRILFYCYSGLRGCISLKIYIL